MLFTVITRFLKLQQSGIAASAYMTRQSPGRLARKVNEPQSNPPRQLAALAGCTQHFQSRYRLILAWASVACALSLRQARIPAVRCLDLYHSPVWSCARLS